MPKGLIIGTPSFQGRLEDFGYKRGGKHGAGKREERCEEEERFLNSARNVESVFALVNEG